EPQPAPTRGLRPCADHVAPRPDVARIAGMMRGIPGIEAIVMIGGRHEQLRAGPHVEVQQLVGLPVEKCPLRAKILVPEARGMAVVRAMVIVLLDLTAVARRAL